MSSPLLNALLLLVTGVVVYGLSRLLRRRLPLGDVDPSPWAATLSYIATAYGIVVGFSIIFLFGEFAEARQAVGDEATAIGTAFEEAQLFPDSQSGIQQSLICYAQIVPESDWPAMQDGEGAPQVDGAFRGVVEAVGEDDLEPVGALHSAAATNLVSQVGNISSARETRLVAAETQLPPMLWVLLVGGGALVVSMIFVVTVPARAGTQATLVALTAIFTVVMVSIVLALSDPFADGPGRVSPELIEQTAASMADALPGSDTVRCPGLTRSG